MTDISRRSLLLSAAAIGAGALTSCARSENPGGASSRDSGGSPAADGRFGAGSYNTQEVADELQYIAESIRPSADGNTKRVLITGSTAGLGQLAAAHLLARGHTVVAHGRNDRRAADVRRDLPDLEDVVIGDLLNLDETRDLATQINELGTFDVIIHNAGEYGLSDAEILNSNSLSPYLLTSLVEAPREVLLYLTSDLHLGGDLELDEVRAGSGVTYDDSKLHMAMLATAVARRRPGLRVNAVAPGWVPTKMGFHNGPYAPDSLREGYMTQVWLAEGIEPESRVTGQFLFHRQIESRVHPSMHDAQAQDDLLAAFARSTGVALA